jgi:hypothetical protein
MHCPICHEYICHEYHEEEICPFCGPDFDDENEDD